MAPSNENNVDLPLWKLVAKGREQQGATAATEQAHHEEPDDASLRMPSKPVEQRLKSIVSDRDLESALSSSSLARPLRFSFGDDYQRDVLLPLQRMASKANEPPDLYGPPNVIRDSHRNEKHLHNSLRILAERLGVVAVVDHLKAHLTKAEKDPKNHYLQRMFGEEEPRRNILSDVNQSFLGGTNLTLGAIEKRTIPQLAARETFLAPLHPKELLLEAIVTHSPDLKNGGRLLVVSDDPVTAKYLALKVKEWPRVSRVEHTLRSGVPESLGEKDSAHSHPEGDIEVFILSRLKLKNARPNIPPQSDDVCAVCAALTVVHDVEVNQRTGQLKGPTPALLPQIRSNGFIQLGHEDQGLKTLDAILDMKHSSFTDPD